MKKGAKAILLALFLVIRTGASEERPFEHKVTRLFITLEEKKQLQPEIMHMRLYLTAKAGTEVEVVNMLGELDRAVRKLKLDYSGGKYSARKNCYYEKGRWKCTGYTGDIEYSFRLSDPKAQNEILETVDNIKNKYGEKIEYSINQPQWVITEKQFTEAEKELRLNIIYSALDFTKQVSSMIGKQCNISGIDFDTKQTFFGPPIYIRSLGMQMEKAVEAPEPKREDKGVSIKAKISIICVEQLTK